jgi:hypothetical protein
VQVDESTERWSEFTLEDGTVVRAKLAVTSAVRVEGEYDAMGNPMYMMNLTPLVTIASSPDRLRKRTQ